MGAVSGPVTDGGVVQFLLVVLTGLEAGGSLVPHTQLPDCR